MERPVRRSGLRWGPVLATSLALAAAASGQAPPPALPAPPRAVPRAILVLFDSRDGETTARSELAEKLHLPLHRLGFRVDFRDAHVRPLPLDPEMAQYHGVVLWERFTECDDEVRDWVLAQHAGGRRLLILEDLEPSSVPIEAAPPCDESDAARNRLLHPLGLHTDSTLDAEGQEDWVQVVRREEGWFDHELPLATRKRLPYRWMRARDPALETLVRVGIRGLPGSEADLVVKGNFGAYAVTGYLWTAWPGHEHDGWIVDPTRFLEAAFGWQGMPRLDPEVVHGRRVQLLRVDGDGFASRVPDRPWLRCGQLFLEDVLRHPHARSMPATVSFVVSDLLDDSPRAFPEAVGTARRILELEGVEGASHTFAHPMDWRQGVLAYDDLVRDGRPLSYDPATETTGSLARLAALAPGAPAPRVLLWSGWCNPGEVELAGLRAAGALQMNGDTPQVPGAMRSRTQLTPPWVQVGDEVRPTARAPSEYLMTGGWAAPFEGYRDVIELFEHTGGPVPWLPVDVYLHFYVAEHAAARAELGEVLAWAARAPLARLFASEYLEGLEDFRHATLAREGAGWRVETAGRLRTVRFEGVEGHPDLGTAEGLLGFVRRDDVLWVHLDEGATHRFAWTRDSPSRAYLEEASRPMDRGPAPAPGEWLTLTGGGPGEVQVTLAGLPAGRPALVVEEPDGRAPRRRTQVVGPDGRLRLGVRLGRRGTLRVRAPRPGDDAWTWRDGLEGAAGQALVFLFGLLAAVAAAARAPWLVAEEEVLG